MTREKATQFASGHLIALGLGAILLTLIFLFSSPLGAAHQATSTAPIVRGAIDRDGAVASQGRPEDITKTNLLGLQLIVKRFALIKEIAPHATRVAILWEPNAYGADAMKAMLQDVGKAAVVAGLSLQFMAVADPAQLEADFSEIVGGQNDGVVVMPSLFLVAERKLIVESMEKARLPAVYAAKEYVRDGGLMSYGPNLTNFGRRPAPYVDNVVKGASRAEDVSLEQLKYELVVNLKTARKLGIAFKPEFLDQVDETIEQ
jgi:putative ABC transport system substrate-binding protein